MARPRVEGRGHARGVQASPIRLVAVSSLPGGQVLVICTGNICRSPYIERVLAHALAGTDVVVTSAGTEALVGSAMHPSSASRLEEAGESADGFVSRQLTAAMIRSADLVIGATREHIAAAAHISPAVLRKGFALLDLGDLLAEVTPDEVAAAPGATRAAKVVAAAIARRSVANPRSNAEAAIADPFRQPEEVYDAMVRDVAAALPAVARALRGEAGAQPE